MRPYDTTTSKFAITPLTLFQLLASVQSVVLLSSCADGLGKSKTLLDAASLTTIQQVSTSKAKGSPNLPLTLLQKYYTSNILFVVVISLSRASIAWFLMQLTPIRQQKQFILLLLGFITLWGFAFLLVIALSCNPSRPWELVGRQCSGYVSPSARQHNSMVFH